MLEKVVVGVQRCQAHLQPSLITIIRQRSHCDGIDHRGHRTAVSLVRRTGSAQIGTRLDQYNCCANLINLC